MDDLIYASATTIARAIRQKQVSSREVVEVYLKRIDAVNPQLNAVVQVMAESALAAAHQADAALARGETHGPLHGVPVTIKDSIETEAAICTGGTKGRASYLPRHDATIVARLRAAGAILLGKTNLPELSLAFETDNLIYGRTNNPYDLSRTPGGSSGGEGAIIAAGGSPLGFGTDAGGSIRLPSHFCGIAGLKPTHGRVPRTGIFPPPVGLLGRLWQVGSMARYVEDLALTFPLIAGVDGRDPEAVPLSANNTRALDFKSLRVAFHTENGVSSPTQETAETVRSAARALSDAGASVEDALPANIEQAFELFRDLFAADGGAGVQGLLQMATTVEPSSFIMQMGSILHPYVRSAAELAEVLARWDLFRASMLSFLQRYDVLLSPVCAEPAIPHGTSMTEERLKLFSYTMTYNLTGWPVVVVRCGTSPEGLPIGVQVIAHPWCEDVALAVAQHLEGVCGGYKKPVL